MPARAQEGSSTGVERLNWYIPSGISMVNSSVENVWAAAVKGRASISTRANRAAVHLLRFTIASVLYLVFAASGSRRSMPQRPALWVL